MTLIISKELREERDVLSKMKLTFVLLICGGLLIITPKVNGDVVVDLFGKIQESAQKLGDDIKYVFESNNRKNKQYKYESPAVSKPVGDKNAVTNPVTSTQAPVTSVKSEEKSNETNQTGRDNFRAACATGYERTPDGRCKPTF